MAVTVYRYDDVGAPVLQSYTPGSLIGLLDACLVNGYGSKPAAGWEKAFSGTNLAAYRQGAGSRFYLMIKDSVSTDKLGAVGYEVMTGVSAGTGLFPTAAQKASGLYITTGSDALTTTKPWVIIADDKRFYLWVGCYFASASALSDSTSGQSLFFFGDVVSFKSGDAYCCQIIGSDVATVLTERFGTIASLSVSVLGHYLARNAAGAAGAISNSKFFDYYGSSSILIIGGASAVAYPDPVSGALNLSRILVSNGTATKSVRGRLPGCWAPLNALPGANGDTFSGAGELAGREFILLDCASVSTRGRVAIETSDTWD